MNTGEKLEYLQSRVPKVYGKNYTHYFHDLTVGNEKLRNLYYSEWLKKDGKSFTNEYILLINLLYEKVFNNQILKKILYSILKKLKMRR